MLYITLQLTKEKGATSNLKLTEVSNFKLNCCQIEIVSIITIQIGFAANYKNEDWGTKQRKKTGIQETSDSLQQIQTRMGSKTRKKQTTNLS